MKKYVYLLLGFVPLFVLSYLADKENYSPIEHAYAEHPSVSFEPEGCNCNSSAPDGTSSNGQDGVADAAAAAAADAAAAAAAAADAGGGGGTS